MATHMTKSIHSPLMKFRYSNTHSVSNMPVDLELYLEFLSRGVGAVLIWQSKTPVISLISEG